MRDTTLGILAAARAEGYREGVSTMSQVAHDEAYGTGREDAYRSFPSRPLWFALGSAATGLLWLLTAL